MKTVSYKLDRFKIIESYDGELWWEAYTGFARTMSGRCFVRGNILFISPFDEISEPGYLIMEYNQLLEKLPPWTKTKYYCHSFVIKTSSEGKALTREEMIKWSREAAQHPATETHYKTTGGFEQKPAPASYRLGRYEIAGYPESGFTWKTWAELDRLKIGAAFIEGDVIFIGDIGATESGVLKSDFIRHLAELPRWTKTRYYCDKHTLKICQSEHPLPIKEKRRTAYEATLLTTKRADEWAAAGKEKQHGEPKAQPGKFRIKKPEFLKILREYRFPEKLGHTIRSTKRLFMAGRPRKHLKRILGAGFCRTVFLLLAGGAVFIFATMEDDKHQVLVRHRKSDDRSHGRSQRDRRPASAGAVSSAESSSYRRNCGECHFAYPPDLLPSGSWQKLIAGLDDHFGAAVALDSDSNETVTRHLTLNAADHSPAKRARKIMDSLGGQNPERISAIPYIRHKHRKIPASVFSRKSIGSLSNCPACHKTADMGDYEGDEAAIPR